MRTCSRLLDLPLVVSGFLNARVFQLPARDTCLRPRELICSGTEIPRVAGTTRLDACRLVGLSRFSANLPMRSTVHSSLSAIWVSQLVRSSMSYVAVEECCCSAAQTSAVDYTRVDIPAKVIGSGRAFKAHTSPPGAGKKNWRISPPFCSPPSRS